MFVKSTKICLPLLKKIKCSIGFFNALKKEVQPSYTLNIKHVPKHLVKIFKIDINL